MSKPIVAIVGRPNVGKSTLFNRLVGERLAIVEDEPGTTRDRVYADARWRGRDFTVVDTGGLDPEARADIPRFIKDQVEMAIAEADVILFLVDVRDGVTLLDEEIGDVLRRWHKPVVLAANKADSARLRDEIYAFYELGLGEPYPVSAYHGRGSGDLLDVVVAHLPPPRPEPVELGLQVAIVGRPNVGKSLLLNAILGEERAIVDAAPGTTRDAIDTVFEHEGERILFIDTAGVRRRGRIEGGVERYSVLRSLRAIGRADVVLLVLDATEMVTAQDMHIAGYVQQAFKGMAVVVNKWDLMREKGADSMERAARLVRQHLRFMPYAPVLFTSALLGEGIEEVLAAAKAIGRTRRKWVEEAALREAFNAALLAHPPPKSGTKQLKVYAVVQTAVNPPTFVFEVNEAPLVHFSYRRYLENRLRSALGFEGTPLHLTFEERERRRRGRR